MKSTGVARKIDELGRIVLPSELRRVFAIHEGDELEISVEGEQIILQKRHDVCVFCGADTTVVEFKGRYVCGGCVDNLRRQERVSLKIPDEAGLAS
jgi:AbrB family transcriptional regulator, transcriptional pleiotropic regulator of transition state genes